VPEELFLMAEWKCLDRKLVLLKTASLRCKIIDIHINKQLAAAAAHLGRVVTAVAE
jgi:hypothetical protein